MRIFLIIGLFFLTGCSKPETLSKPEFESIVLDNRSYCERISEMAYSEKWDELCGANCQLTNANIAKLYGALS